MAWELRYAWASGRRVVVTFERDGVQRVEGHVHAVSTTGVSVTVAGVMIPLDALLAVHHPSRLGDSTFRRGRWAGDPRAPKVAEGQLSLPV